MLHNVKPVKYLGARSRDKLNKYRVNSHIMLPSTYKSRTMILKHAPRTKPVSCIGLKTTGYVYMKVALDQ